MQNDFLRHSAFHIQHSAFPLRFLQQNDIHRKVVTIPSHPDATGEGAEGIAVVAAAVLLQKLLVVDLRVLELVAVVAIGQQGRSEDHLVEHTGRIAVEVGAVAFFVQLVHGVEKLAVAQVFHVARGTQVFRNSFVGRIVVEVAHHDNLGVLVLAHDAVGDVAAQLGGGNAARHGTLLTAHTRRPVHHDEVHHLAIEEAGNDQLVTGDELRVAGNDGMIRLAVRQLEIFRVIEQPHIHATAVGRVVVHHLIVATLDFGLGHQVFKHMAVLNLRHAKDSYAVGCDVGADGGDGIGHVMEFVEVFLGIPLVGALGQELLVVFLRVVDGVEEVFQVIEADQTNFIGLFFLCVEARKTKDKGQKSKYESKVFVHVERDIRVDNAAKVAN